MGRNTGYKSNHYDFTFSRVRDNLFKVFGTKSYFAMLSPSLRYNPFNGIEWSFQMKDLGFNEYGEVSSKYADNDEESKFKPSTEMTNVSGSAVMAEDDDPEGEEEAEGEEAAEEGEGEERRLFLRKASSLGGRDAARRSVSVKACSVWPRRARCKSPGASLSATRDFTASAASDAC